MEAEIIFISPKNLLKKSNELFAIDNNMTRLCTRFGVGYAVLVVKDDTDDASELISADGNVLESARDNFFGTYLRK